MRTARTVLLMTQMRREQCDTPPRRPVPQMKGIAVQMPENLGSRHLGRGHRTATPRGLNPGGHLLARQRALEPVVAGLPIDTRQCSDRADRLPLGHPQHGLYALQEACLRGTL
jgi:hypothetical protein